MVRSFIDPFVGGGLPVGKVGFGEPEADLVLGRFDGVRSVADVTANIDGEVSSDGAREGSEGVGLAKHLSALLDDVLAFPNHGDNGAGEHVSDERGEEALGLEVLVVLLKELLRRLSELQSNQLVAALLETFDDLADKTALDAIGLDHDESAFSGHSL